MTRRRLLILSSDCSQVRILCQNYPEKISPRRRSIPAGIRETDLPVTLDHYTLVEKIGEGATGELYRAIDERLRREVAVKLLKPELAAIPTARARFEREARACAALKHDHIVAVHHVEASDSDRCPYLVMDYVLGGLAARTV